MLDKIAYTCHMTNQKPSGQLVMRTVAMPCDTNANGDIFGGWMLAQMDLGGSILAKERAQNRTATVAIDSMTFLNPVKVGDVVSCYATIAKTGNTSISIEMEAWVSRYASGVSAKVTEGRFTYVSIDEAGRPKPLP